MRELSPPRDGDPWINQHLNVYELSELDGCAVGIDAAYFIRSLQDNKAITEPLLSALAGMTGIEKHMDDEIQNYLDNNVTPFFIFDGQPVVGQDDVTVAAAKRDIARTDLAWELYAKGQADEAVAEFGKTTLWPRLFYPVLQKLLQSRKLHYLVAPYNAAAQLAYLDSSDSDQVAAIMGSQELLLYSIADSVIQHIDWDEKKIFALSKKQIMKELIVSEPLFVDCLLMTGTSFLPAFPPLQDSAIVPRQASIMDASNMLRTVEKNIAKLCASFHDILQVSDPLWLDKFRKARMVISHYIYIAETGEVRVNDYDKLTGDNLEYLGLQLPAEAFHYLNVSLVSPRVLSWITHCRVTVLPTLDGHVTDVYRNLVTKQLVPYYETALGLVIPRLNRGIHFRDVHLRVWYDDKISQKLNHRGEGQSATARIAEWKVSDEALATYFPKAQSGTVVFEVLAVANKDFVAHTVKAKKAMGLASANTIVSLTLWKLLTLRGYITEKTLELTPWGFALAKTCTELKAVVQKYPYFSGLYASALLAFELIRLGVLTPRNYMSEQQPSTSHQISSVLISRVATLLQLRQEAGGYTGPLSKDILNFHSLTTAVAEADRGLIEAMLLSSFMEGQAQRDRSDYWEISSRPDTALAIAVKTYFDEVHKTETSEARKACIESFASTYVPKAIDVYEDFEVTFAFFQALCDGIDMLGPAELKGDDTRAAWETAREYLKNYSRPE